MRVEVDQSSRARDGRVIRRVLVQPDARETPQRQRVRQPPGNPALRPDALEIPDQQCPKVNPRRQRRTPVLGRIKFRASLLDKLVEALRLQQLIQTLIKRMPRRCGQFRVRDPDVLLLLPLLTRPHRHAPILRTKSVDTTKAFFTNLDLHHGLLGNDGIPHNVFPELQAEALLSSKGADMVFAGAPKSLQQVFKGAGESLPQAIPLAWSVRMHTVNSHQRIESENVVGAVQGS